MTDINRRKMIFAALALSACSGLALACDAQSTSPLARTASAAQTSRDRSRSGAGKPTIVLVHGAWHTGAEMEAVAGHLRKSGHLVHCPTVAGNNKDDDREKTGGHVSQSRGHVFSLSGW